MSCVRPPDPLRARRTRRAPRAARTGGRPASRGRSPARNSSAAAPCTARPTIDRAPSSRVAADAQHEPPDRIRRAAAVVEHVAPRGVASRRGILTERAQQIVEQRQRKIERSDRVRRARRAIRSSRLSAADGAAAPRDRRRGVQASLPGSEPRRRSAGGASLRRRCRRRRGRTRRPRRRAAASARQQARRDGKILVVRSRQRSHTRRRRARAARAMRRHRGILVGCVMRARRGHRRRLVAAARRRAAWPRRCTSIGGGASARATSERAARPRRSSPSCPTADDLVLFSEDADALLLRRPADRQGPHRRGPRADQRRADRRPPCRGAARCKSLVTPTSFEDRPEGIARDRWDVAIETDRRDGAGRVRRDSRARVAGTGARGLRRGQTHARHRLTLTTRVSARRPDG